MKVAEIHWLQLHSVIHPNGPAILLALQLPIWHYPFPLLSPTFTHFLLHALWNSFLRQNLPLTVHCLVFQETEEQEWEHRMRKISVHWSFLGIGESTAIVWDHRLTDRDKKQKGSAGIAWSCPWHLARYLPNLFSPQSFSQKISAVFLQKHFHCFALVSRTFSQCALWISFAAVHANHIR